MHVVSIDPFVDVDEIRSRVHLPHLISPLSSATDLSRVEVVLTAEVGLVLGQLKRMPRLREVITAGVGVDHLDLGLLEGAGVNVTNVPDYCTEEVSDHAVALTCALFRSLPRFLTDPGSAWASPRGVGVKRFSSVHVGVLGTGRIGQALSRKLASLGMRVSVARRPQSTHAVATQRGIEAGELDDLLPVIDVLVVTAPGSTGDTPLLGGDRIRAMQRGAFVVNVSRASLVDLSALEDSLQSGHLAGAFFDVWDPEPPVAFDELSAIPGLSLSPHSGWFSPESEASLWSAVAERLDRLEWELGEGNPHSQ